MKYVNAYEIKLKWGGCEGGGWFYETFNPLMCVACPNDSNRIVKAILDLLETFEDKYNRLPNLSSGRDDAAELLIKVEDNVARPYSK